jgi:stalled ribosome rescue protein Dom34
MKNVILWIDKNHAHLFNSSEQGIIPEGEIDLNKIDHHNGVKKDKKDKGEGVFYNAIMKKLYESENVVVIGPGIVKDKFIHHCEKFDPSLFKKIIGSEISGNRLKGFDLEFASEKYFDWKL